MEDNNQKPNLSEEQKKLIEDYDAKIQERRKQDSQRELLANAVKALGTIGQAEVQRKAKTNAGIQKFQPVQDIDTTSDLKEKRKMLLDSIKMKMDQVNADRISPLQQAQLDLSRDKLTQDREMKEAALEAKKQAADKKAEKTSAKKVTEFQKKRQKNTADRFSELESSIPNRNAQIEEAKTLINLIQGGDLSTGPGSKLAGSIGSFFGTEESSYKERLDSLAEKAARAQLKANGETRPTDADVEGMKRAMFNLGNTEETNIKKLQDFIKAQQSGISEYGKMKEVMDDKQGLEDFILNRDGEDPQVNEVKRKTKDGRTAIFNADTKEFIRYE